MTINIEVQPIESLYWALGAASSATILGLLGSFIL